MRNLVLALALVAMPLSPALAQMNHGSHAGMADGVHATAKLNSVGDGSVNVSHDPIPAIGWPAMTMDMPLLGDVDTSGVAPGDSVTIMLEKGDDGMYGITAIEPAE
ncbi:cation transporter [Acuticoccus sediminis]|uniref:Cation transporter n=1 Tax=Acuticoccus sediminis TaxID=2184697 RepID=A0A8B2P2N4_9HYPH|nr:copper-binding protein [Acuticoccus sediminis]RAI02517.1 cation transporter [Acuticoccus sediminis]